MAKFHIKKGDTVKVISGESKGEEGKVLEVYPTKNRALVEGVNIVKRHTKPNAAHPNGGIVEKEASIQLSNLMLVDPKTGEPTRTGRKLVDGKLVRYSKKSGEVIK
ncbi:MAG: 50S ribosomal protein L24 [Flavobacteriales bacterium]|nr:50S ribosomal protein L24 [Flavobacteriales bacterium]